MVEKDIVAEYCRCAAKNFEALADESANIIDAANTVAAALAAGNKILLCGNGGSAADAQHIAAELMGRYKQERAALPAIALTTDTSALTAIGNDYGFEHIFSRQAEGLGAPGDVLIAISTSGNSANVLKAADAARAGGMKVIALTGAAGGALVPKAHIAVQVPSDETNHIQEMHIAVGHMICELAEGRLTAGPQA